MNNTIETGMKLFNEIEAARKPGEKWRWETRIPGPLTSSEVSAISALAGCWSYEASAGYGGYVRFYANQNHPSHGGRPLG